MRNLYEPFYLSPEGGNIHVYPDFIEIQKCHPNNLSYNPTSLTTTGACNISEYLISPSGVWYRRTVSIEYVLFTALLSALIVKVPTATSPGSILLRWGQGVENTSALEAEVESTPCIG